MELTLESELSREVALEKHDRTALTKDQQERLNQHKVNATTTHPWHDIQYIHCERTSSLQIVTRLENEHYLRAHPEVPVMMSAFLRQVYYIVHVVINSSLT